MTTYGFNISTTRTLKAELANAAEEFSKRDLLQIRLRLISYSNTDKERAVIMVDIPEHIRDFMYYFAHASNAKASFATTNAPWTSFFFSLYGSKNITAQGVGCLQTVSEITHEAGENGIPPYLGNHFYNQLCLGYDFKTGYASIFDFLISIITYYYNSTFNGNLDYYISWPTLHWIGQDQKLVKSGIADKLMNSTTCPPGFENWATGVTRKDVYEYIDKIYSKSKGKNTWSNFPRLLQTRWRIGSTHNPIVDQTLGFQTFKRHLGLKEFKDVLENGDKSLYDTDEYRKLQDENLKTLPQKPLMVPSPVHTLDVLNQVDLSGFSLQPSYSDTSPTEKKVRSTTVRSKKAT